MLNDRDYMRGGRDYKAAGPSVVKMIIVVNVLVFLLQNTSSNFTGRFLLIPQAVTTYGQYYRVFTYMFLHGGFFHILMNMWMLYLFGGMLEKRIGSINFAVLYFVSGLLGGLFYMFANWNMGMGCLGASGAVVGVSIATAMFFPDLRIMLLFPPIPMKLKTFTIVFLLLEIFLEYSNAGRGGVLGNIAHTAHLGGALGAYLYLKILFGKEIVWDILPKFGGRKIGTAYKPPPPGWSFIDKGTVPQSEIDRLLDKISETGINSLTQEEEEILRKAREQMMKR